MGPAPPMQKSMPPVRVDLAPSRRLLRSLAVASAVASSAPLSAVLPGAVALADEPAGTTVVGELVQAWPEAEPRTARARRADGAAQLGRDGRRRGRAGRDRRRRRRPRRGPPSTSPSADPSTEARRGRGPGPRLRGAADADVRRARAAAGPAHQRGHRRHGGARRVGPTASAPAGRSSTSSTARSPTSGRSRPTAPSPSASPRRTTGSRRPPAAAARGALERGRRGGRLRRRPGQAPAVYLAAEPPACAYALAEVGSAPASGGRLYVRDAAGLGDRPRARPQLRARALLGRCSATASSTGRPLPHRRPTATTTTSWAPPGRSPARSTLLQAARLGVLPAGRSSELTVQGSATAVRWPRCPGRTGTRALRLADADGVDYWLEYRTAAGRDAWLGTGDNRFGLEAGVLLRRTGTLPRHLRPARRHPAPPPAGTTTCRPRCPSASRCRSPAAFTVVLRELTAAGAVLCGVRPAPRPAVAPGAPAPPDAGPAPAHVLPGGGQAPAADAPAADAAHGRAGGATRRPGPRRWPRRNRPRCRCAVAGRAVPGLRVGVDRGTGGPASSPRWAAALAGGRRCSVVRRLAARARPPLSGRRPLAGGRASPRRRSCR